MNRAFISLYLVIVISVVLVGWGTDKLWEVYNPEPEAGPFEQLFFLLVEQELSGAELPEAEQKSRKLSALLGQNIQIYSLADLARSSLADRISEGDIVAVYDEEGRKSSYKRISHADYIVRVDLDQKNPDHGRLYIVLLIAFYTVIALVIYFWIWPLSRDLGRLRNQTQNIGVDGAPAKVNLGHRSAVYPLASSFNKMAERIDELLASHREMTYAVSHELRTPLARMKFALEMAKHSAASQTAEKQLDSVREDVAEMDKLISELLAYAGFEQQSQQLELKVGDLKALVDQLLAAQQQSGAQKFIQYEIKNYLPANRVKAEWYLLERCLHNVIQNAAKYSKSKICVSLATADGNYQVYVEDDGPGVMREDQEKIFKAFVRLRNEADENKSGFGLGLAIVHRIMKWHGGGVSVAASELGGAKFLLYWPIPPG